MRHELTLLLAAVLALPLLVLTAPTASACSCTASGSVDSLLADADLVVEASARSSRTIDGERAYTFDVERTWKGSASDVVVVTTALSEASCGRVFVVGEPQVVLAVAGGDGWRTDLCRGAVAPGTVEAVLGRGQPAGVDIAPPAQDPGAPVRGAVVAAAVAGLVLLVVLVRRRRP